jgi:hypothetical protein
MCWPAQSTRLASRHLQPRRPLARVATESFLVRSGWEQAVDECLMMPLPQFSIFLLRVAGRLNFNTRGVARTASEYRLKVAVPRIDSTRTAVPQPSVPRSSTVGTGIYSRSASAECPSGPWREKDRARGRRREHDAWRPCILVVESRSPSNQYLLVTRQPGTGQLHPAEGVG